MSKARIKLFLCCFFLLFATGCVSPVAEVNRLAIVDAVGVDEAPGGMVRVTAHVIVPNELGIGGGSGGGGGAAAAPFYTLDAVAESFPAAIDLLDLQVPRRLFLGHTQIAIVGEGLARRGLFALIDFLIRSRELRPDLLMAVTKGEARELLNVVPPLPSVTGQAWKNQIKEQRSPVTSVRNFHIALGEEGIDPYLTAVAPRPVKKPGAQSGGDAGELAITGTALFHGDVLVGYLDTRQTEGLQLMQQSLGRLTVTVPASLVHFDRNPVSKRERTPEESKAGPEVVDTAFPSFTMDVRSVKSSITPVSLSPLHLKVRSRVKDDLSANNTTFDVEKPQVAKALADAASRDIEIRMADALAKMQKVGSDALGLGAKFRRQRPEWWRDSLRFHWDDLYAKAKMEYDVQVAVKRTGLSTRPIGLRKQQIKD